MSTDAYYRNRIVPLTDDEVKIIAMGRKIRGMTDDHAMRMKIAEASGWQQAVTLGNEAIRREHRRVEVFNQYAKARELAHAG